MNIIFKVLWTCFIVIISEFILGLIGTICDDHEFVDKLGVVFKYTIIASFIISCITIIVFGIWM